MHGTRLRVAVSVRLADEPTAADSTQGRMGRPFKLLSRVMAWCTGLPVTRPGFNARDGSLSFHSPSSPEYQKYLFTCRCMGSNPDGL